MGRRKVVFSPVADGWHLGQLHDRLATVDAVIGQLQAMPPKRRTPAWAASITAATRQAQSMLAEIAALRRGVEEAQRQADDDSRPMTPAEMYDLHSQRSAGLDVRHLELYVVEFLRRHAGQGLYLATSDGPVEISASPLDLAIIPPALAH